MLVDEIYTGFLKSIAGNVSVSCEIGIRRSIGEWMRCLITNHGIGITEAAAKFGELGGEAATIYILRIALLFRPPGEQ